MDWIYGHACGTLPAMQPGFAALHFGVAFGFHERVWRKVDGHAPARNNGPAMCCGMLKAR